MEKLVLYTTHCPKCKVIEMKLKQKNLEYDVVDDADTVIETGKAVKILSAPILKVGEDYLDFAKANQYLKEVNS